MVELPDAAKNAKARETMLALGYDEAISISFISEQEAKTFGGGELLGVANPLNEESACLRTSLLPGLINMVAYNLNRGTTNVRLFEAEVPRTGVTGTTSGAIWDSLRLATPWSKACTPRPSPIRSST